MVNPDGFSKQFDILKLKVNYLAYLLQLSSDYFSGGTCSGVSKKYKPKLIDNGLHRL